MFQWKTLKVFVSSTFKDMELERDELAGVFTNIKNNLRDRQLQLSPYDLRWRHRHVDDDIVGWCIEMVEQCQYFIGILGFRYGWRPPEDGRGGSNDKNISITEMEIRHALEKVEPQRRLFLFGDLSQYSEEALKGEIEEDRKSLEELKEELRRRGETVFEFRSHRELLSIIGEEFGGILDKEYPPGKKVDLVKYTREDALAEILEEKRKGFVGREEYLKKLQDFALSDSEKNYLAVRAVAGTGKSALLA